MDDSQRKKILLSGLAVVIVSYFGLPLVTSFVMGPVNDMSKELKKAEQANERLAKADRELKIAKNNLKDWRYISLPPDADDAQRVYREWLFDLAKQCGFSGPAFEVIPGARTVLKEFTTVSVEVKKAETDLQGLTRFLYLFDNAGLLHRISNLKIDSPGAQGNPRLAVSFTAEGMSVAGAQAHADLLPRTKLTAAVTESATEIKAAPSESFLVPEPFEPFEVRIEKELLKVTGVTESGWTVQRGFEGTKAASHPESAYVELFPELWDRKEKQMDHYAAFLAASPFVIPSPPKAFNPRLGGVSDKTIKPGEAVKFTARAENFNTELGEPQFALTEAVEGMTIDPKSGEFSWTPAADLGSGKYAATVVLTQNGNPDVKLNSKVTFTIRSDNKAPVLNLPKSVVVILEQPFEMKLDATDDGKGELKFSLGAGSPAGLTIDAKTGQLNWTPARTLAPDKYRVEIKVADTGDDPKTTTGTLEFDVQEDYASLTLMTGALTKNGVWCAWFRNKATGKTEELKAGEKLKVSEIDAELVSISNQFVTLRDAAGLWKLGIGKGVRERKLIEPAPAPRAPDATSAEPKKDDAAAPVPAAAPSETPATPTAEPTTPAPATPAGTPAEPKPETPAAEPTPQPESPKPSDGAPVSPAPTPGTPVPTPEPPATEPKPATPSPAEPVAPAAPTPAPASN